MKQLWNNLKSTIVIILSLTVCITSVFLMAEAMLYSNTFLQNIEENRRTYSLEGSGYSEDYERTYTLYNEVMYGDCLPEIAKFYGIYANPILSDNVENYFGVTLYSEGDSRYAVELDLIDGRSFTDKEITEGSNVIVLSYLENRYHTDNEYKVGDTVLINDVSYEIIGINGGINSYITEQNILNNHNFYIYFDTIAFAKRLSSTEEQAFVDLFNAIGSTPVSWYEQYFSGFAIHVATCIVLIGLVSYCAFSIIAQLFKFMVKSREYEYNIYKILGIRRSLLAALYFMPILLVSVLSGILGLLIYRHTELWQSIIGMGDVLSSGVCAVCFVIIGFVLLIAVLPNYRRLCRQSAVETR